eukprot:TRINITY_DN432_c0_g1_i7.p1 TRINITY_DN432_c0_g1~~TRINITY_DN432_c0_g1_i7.p1  ORF type:complete len:316 (-),score=63.82 TRINITY_DN432_c0_g1_i7:232-1179(-)
MTTGKKKMMRRSTKLVCSGARRRRSSYKNSNFSYKSGSVVRSNVSFQWRNQENGSVTSIKNYATQSNVEQNNDTKNATTHNKKYGHIQEFVTLVNNKLGSGQVKLKDVLTTVWQEEAITAQCRDFIIRLTSLRGEVSKAVWEMRGGNPDEVQILAVGTTAIPNHIPQLLQFFNNFYSLSTQHYKSSHSVNSSSNPDSLPEIGYDLLSKGSEASRRAVLNLFNEHYGFDNSTIEQFIKSSAITSGGMRGLKDLADSMIINCPNPHKHRFIQPDNSFGTWWNIIESTTPLSSHRRDIFRVSTSQAPSRTIPVQINYN